MVGEVRRAPDRRLAHRAPHPAMAEGWCAGGWVMDAARGRDATGWECLTLIGERIWAPVRVRRYCSFVVTVSWWECTSSLWRWQWSSSLLMVSFQRTA